MKENNKEGNITDSTDKDLYKALTYTITIMAIMWGLSFVIN